MTPSPDAASAPRVALEWHDQVQLGGALFPEGVQLMVEREARLPLYHSDSPLLAPAHLSFKLHAEATPAFVPRAGPAIEFEPIAFFDCGARLYGTFWLGAFSAMIPADSADFAGTRQERRALIAAGERDAGWSLRADLHARLKAKVWRVIALAELEGRHHHAETASGPFDYWWEPSEMLTIASDAWVIDKKAWLFGELIRAETEADRKLWIGGVAMDVSAPSTGDHSLRVGAVALIKPTAAPAMPLFIVGAMPWVTSRFAEPLPPYVVIAAQWNR